MNLSEIPECDSKWKSISIDNKNYSITATETNGTWKIALTDFIYIWTEELDREKIFQKCEKLNPTLSIEDIDIYKIVGDILKDIPKNSTKVSVEQIELSCELEGDIFEFTIDTTLGSAEELWKNVTMPMFVAVGELRRREKFLTSFVKKKDTEISEYKLNGGELIRKYIGTKPFDEELLKKNVPTQNLESCHNTFQEIMKLKEDLKVEKYSVKAEPTKMCLPENLVHAAIKSAASNESLPKIRKRQRHILLSVEGPARKKRRRCVECYRKHRQSGLSAADAATSTKQVKTYCDNCSEKPHLCLSCFNSIHENISTESVSERKNTVKIEGEEHLGDESINLVKDKQGISNIEENMKPETVTEEPSEIIPKVEKNSPPESPKLETKSDERRIDTPKRMQKSSVLPVKRAKKSILDYIK